jgi:hypothetical protein
MVETRDAVKLYKELTDTDAVGGVPLELVDRAATHGWMIRVDTVVGCVLRWRLRQRDDNR